MNNNSARAIPPSLDEETIPVVISVAPEHQDTLERWAARRGMSGVDLFEELARKAFGPLGARIER